MSSFIKRFHSEKIIIGVDEAGRGCGAGPVVAAAVIMDKKKVIQGVNDSKKLSKKQRTELYPQIIKNSISVGIGCVGNKIIDKINILRATKIAMKVAVFNCLFGLDMVDKKKILIKIDGNFLINFDKQIKEISIIKGDSLSYDIAAASIVAKVSRDNIISQYDIIYPEYKFSKHKGYLTKFHRNILKEQGISPIHRFSFVKKFL